MPAGPIQHFRDAILEGWRNCVSADLCGRMGSRCGPHLDWHALVCSSREDRRPGCGVRDYAFLPGPPTVWEEDWTRAPRTGVGEEDVSAWPYSVSILVRIAAFKGTSHWPSEEKDLGLGEVSNLEILILYEVWAGERLICEKSIPKGTKRRRGISVLSANVGSGVEIWKSWRFLGMSCALFGICLVGIHRFAGGNHGRLRQPFDPHEISVLIEPPQHNTTQYNTTQHTTPLARMDKHIRHVIRPHHNHRKGSTYRRQHQGKRSRLCTNACVVAMVVVGGPWLRAAPAPLGGVPG